MKLQKKIYFASDFHLGIDGKHASHERERRIIRWLDQIAADASKIYLVGDLFDFWFEYGEVVPKGYFRFLSKLAELQEKGVALEIFTGNHDMWMFDYLEKELNLTIHRKPIQEKIEDKLFFIGHGDGLGPGDHGYKFIKKVFANPICQWLFARIHPNTGIRIARFWSGKSRDQAPEAPAFMGPEKEWLVQYADQTLQTDFYDYFIFGHRHLPIDYTLDNQKSRYINLGDWLHHYSYAVFDGQELHLKYYED